MANWHSFSRPQSGQVAGHELIRGIEAKSPHAVTSDPLHQSLMRLRRGRLCQGRRTRAQGTDSRCVGSGMNCAVLSSLPAYSLRAALRERPSAAFRAAQIIRRSSGPVPRFTKRARGTVTLRADPRPADVGWTSAQPPWELRGGFVSANLGRCRLAGARPRSIGAVPGKERERCSLSARRCACAALTWGASGIFRAVWP